MKTEELKNLEIEISAITRTLREKGIPAIIIFAGWSAAGRGTLISKLINIFDPRLYNVITKSVLSEKAEERNPFQKFWINTPEKGRIAIFERSPYDELSAKFAKEGELSEDFLDEIISFERTLAAEGVLILKIFLDISAKEQKRRLKKLEKDKNTCWRVSKRDWNQNKNYEEYKELFCDVIEQSSKDYAPWKIVDSTDLKEARTKIFLTIKDFLSEGINNYAPSAKITNPYCRFTTDSVIDKIDLSHKIERGEYEEKIRKLQKKLLKLEFELYRKRIPAIIVFEGVDAAGKGGAIKRLTQGLDPRGFEVVPIAAPDDKEKKHHYLWRFWNKFPKGGHITIFDRSWYGRVLVERVEGFCSEYDWGRAYTEINEMEKCFVDWGGLIIKFWLHISQDEQLRRFNDRQNTDWKKWKITDEDWRNREKWQIYKEAIDEMLSQTNSVFAPWTIVEAECKLYLRIKVLSTVIERLKQALN